MENSTKKIEFHEPIEVYALVDKNKEDLKHSASGGAFMVFARPIIKRGGIVFGCVLEDDGTCYHKSVTTLEELRPMQGSKYVRSSVRNTFEECQHALMENKQVLYSGTPCQIASLYTFLKKHKLQKSYYKNLLTIDLFCHGTPSQKLFKQYIQWLSEKHKTDDGIHNYIFRSKKKGWGPDLLSYTYKRNNKCHNKFNYGFEDPYYAAFLKSYTLSKTCYNCKYAQENRCSDVSIGDFWGIQKHHLNFYKKYKNDGISAITINTKTGELFFKEYCKNNCLLEKSTINNIKQCSIDSNDNTVSDVRKNNISLQNKIVHSSKDNEVTYLFETLLKISKSERVYKKAYSFAALHTPKKIKQLLKGQ